MRTRTRARYIAAALAAVLVCPVNAETARMPISIRTTVSSFDDATEISMAPGFVSGAGGKGSGGFQLGLFWSSRMRQDGEIVIVARVADMGSEAGFNNIGELDIRIGEEFFTFEPSGITEMDYDVTEFANFTSSAQRYSVPIGLAKRMASESDVRLRLRLDQTSYLEGTMAGDRRMSAPRGFRKFFEEMAAHGF